MSLLKVLQYEPLSTVLQEGTFAPSVARRWVREPFETCVDKVMRSSRLLSEYVASYKLWDPQWQPLLMLPCGNPICFDLRARHVNVALRHLVQKGHAMYFVTQTQHTVLHPRGIAERAYVQCSMGLKNERLVTLLYHEGPINAKDPTGPRATLGISESRSFACNFRRFPMLIQRSRRVGALQGQSGAFDWLLCAPNEVGRQLPEESFLLANHMQSVGGGATAVGIVSSQMVAKHPYQYLADFEAPSSCAVDAVHQLLHWSALGNQLTTSGEALHAIAFNVRTPPPFCPLENELQFQVQCSAPQVFRDFKEMHSGVVGTPYVSAKSVSFSEFSVRQGCPEFIYDQGPSHRPARWWRQHFAIPYFGNMYWVRDGLLDTLRVEEDLPNPFLSLESDTPLRPHRGASKLSPQVAARVRRAHQSMKGAK